jgi:SAM-dependent methyltransferase
VRPSPRSVGETFDLIAEAFDATRAWPWPFVKEWMEGLGPLALPVVDVGCGNGRHLALAASLGKWGVGVDLSPRLVSIARQRLPGTITVAVGDARRLPLGNGVAGAVLAVAMLHHVPDEEGRWEVASELNRIARPGAPVMASVWALDDPEVAQRASARPDDTGDPRDLLVPWRASEGTKVDRYYRAIPMAELAELMAMAGMVVVQAGDVGPNHVVHARRPK